MTEQTTDEAAANAAAANTYMNLHELVAKARANLNQNDWDYIPRPHGGAETEERALRRNRVAARTRSRSGRACCAT